MLGQAVCGNLLWVPQETNTILKNYILFSYKTKVYLQVENIPHNEFYKINKRIVIISLLFYLYPRPFFSKG